MAGKLQALQLWCQKRVEGYRDVEVTNMTTSWRSGLAFCAVLHRFRPDLIDYDALSKENVFENNDLAFRVAEQELGIAALLEAQDMIAMKVPDRLSVITYVAQYHNYFRDKEMLGGPGVKGTSAPKKATTPASGVKRHQPQEPTKAPEAKKFAARQDNALNKVDAKDMPRMNSMSDICEICKKKVYILERHIENSKLYHRSCFRHSDMSPASKIYARPSGIRSGDTDKTSYSNNTDSKLGFPRTRRDNIDKDVKSDFRNGHKGVMHNDIDKRSMESRDRNVTSSPRTDLLNLISETDSEISKITNGYSSDRHKVVKNENAKTNYSVDKSENTHISDRFNKLGNRTSSPVARPRSAHSSDGLVNESKHESRYALSKSDVKSEPISILSHVSKQKTDVEKMETDSRSPVPRTRMFLKKDEAKTRDHKLHTDDKTEQGELAKPLPSPRENARGRFKSSSSEHSDISAPPPLPSTMPPPAARSLIQEIKQNRKQIHNVENDKSELKSPRRPNQVSKTPDDRLQAKKTQSKQLPVVVGQKSVNTKRNKVQSPANSDINFDIGHESGDSDADIDDLFAKAQVYQAGGEQTAVLVIPGKKQQSQESEETGVLSGLLKSLAGVRKQQGDISDTRTDQKFVSPPNINTSESEKTVNGSKNENINQANIKSHVISNDDHRLPSKVRSQPASNKATDNISDRSNVKNVFSNKQTDNVTSAVDTSKRTNLKTDPASRLKMLESDKKLEMKDRATNDSIPKQNINLKSPLNLKSDLASNNGVQNILLRKKKDVNSDLARPKSASVLLDNGKYKLSSTSKDDSEMRTEIRPQVKKEQKRDNVKSVDFSTNLRKIDNNRNFDMKKNAGDKESEEKLPWQLEAEKRMTAASKGKFLDPSDPKALEKRKQLKSSQENLTNIDNKSVTKVKDRSQFKVEQNSKSNKSEVTTDIRVRTDKSHDISKAKDSKVEPRKQRREDKLVPRYTSEERHNKIGDIGVNIRVPDRKVIFSDDNVNISRSKDSRSPPLHIDLTDDRSSPDGVVSYNAKSDKTDILSRNNNDKDILSTNRNGHLNPSDGKNFQPSVLHIDLTDDNAAYDNRTETVHLSPRNRNNNMLQDTLNEHDNNNALPSSAPQRPLRKLVPASQDVIETDLDNIKFNYDVPPRRPNRLPIENDVSNLRKLDAPKDILSPQMQIFSHKRRAPPPPCMSPSTRSPSPPRGRDRSPSPPLQDHNRLQSPDRAGKYYKRPAPERPAPHKRSISHCRMSAVEIQRSLRDIDSKLTDLELKGRELEDAIRNAGNNDDDEEDLMIDWFSLINNKNELIREEADMIYAARAQELEQEQMDVEYRLRCLMTKLDHKKTDEDSEEEAYLLQRLLDLVDQRSRIVDSIDEDKQRYEEEDKNIAIMMVKKGLVRNTEGEKTSAFKIKM